jgi:hypothetical protein
VPTAVPRAGFSVALGPGLELNCYAVSRSVARAVSSRGAVTWFRAVQVLAARDRRHLAARPVTNPHVVAARMASFGEQEDGFWVMRVGEWVVEPSGTRDTRTAWEA